MSCTVHTRPFSAVSCGTRRSPLRHACSVPSRLSVSRLLPLLSSSSILSIFLSSSSILITLYFRPSRLHPPPVLLHPRPPIISSSTHPPFVNRRLPLTTLARQPLPRLSIDFAAAVGRTLPVVAATLLLLLVLHPLPPFFFQPLRQSKKKKPLYRVG